MYSQHCGGIDRPEEIHAEAAIVENRLQRVKSFELRNVLPEIDFVFVEAGVSRHAQFLAVEDHRRAVHRAAREMADERLKCVAVSLFVMRSVVEQHQSLVIDGIGLLVVVKNCRSRFLYSLGGNRPAFV